jgi:cell wall-associated NlpC family hydrolase
VDCSGFVQTVFKVLGIKLPRDAYQQAKLGKTVESLSAAETGDIVFFQNEENNITHVGIFLGGGQVVHASGKVRVDELTEEGIIKGESGEKTHQFNCIKRFI